MSNDYNSGNYDPNNNPQPVSYVDPSDAPSLGFAVLGFFIPLVGLILYLVWKDKTPQKAKSCGKGAIIGFVCSFVFVFLGSCLATSCANGIVDYYY